MIDRLGIIAELYDQATEYFGSTLAGDVAADAFDIVGAIVTNVVVDISTDSDMYEFLTCTFEPDDYIWDFINVEED